MNFNGNAAQSIYIKLVRIPDEDLFRQNNCFNKNYAMEKSQFIGCFNLLFNNNQSKWTQ